LKKSFFIISIIILFLKGIVFSQEIRKVNTLNYTYIGPIMSLGYSSVDYKTWKDTEYVSKKSTGITYSGGVTFCIFANNLLGDTKIKYVYNGTDDAITYAEFSLSGKYLWKLQNNMYAGLGLGIYCETPPSNKTHDGGAGLELPLTYIVNITTNTKLLTEINLKYGTFGIGEDPTHLYYGCSIAFVTKVGRI